MREIVFDTETTGLEPTRGDRVVEIGAVELFNHLPTGNTFHQYINPERAMPQEAFDIHGLGDDFLRDKPRFAQIARSFLDFIGTDAKLIAHNADFDMRFINAELAQCNLPQIPASRALDSAALARRKFPGSPASLDALCRRFGIDNSARDYHGALLDSQLLAEVYLELIGGRQPDLVLDQPAQSASPGATAATPSSGPVPRARPFPLPPRLTDAEARAHAEMVAKLGENAIWRRWSEA